MEYIVHKRFKEKALCGRVNLPAMTICQEHDNIIYLDNKPLCFITSENAHKHFANNEDGNGVYRGEIISNIIKVLRKQDKKHQQRWNLIWDSELCKKYKRIEYNDHWIWNHEFYEACIEDLEFILNLIKNIN